MFIIGAGFINNSNTTQEFNIVSATNGSYLKFLNSATAGDRIHFTIDAKNHDPEGSQGSGLCWFWDTSTAGNAVFTVNDGQISFLDNSTAANAIISHGNYAARTTFTGQSTAGNATLVIGGADYSELHFGDDSSGGTARVVFKDGSADPNYSYRNGVLRIYYKPPGLTLGSIEGLGEIVLYSSGFLETIKFTVGSNDLSTAFSGVIREYTTPGSLTKIGIGKLTLTGASTYTGGTFINGGAIWADNTTGSATGTGPVKVNVGTLRGNGRVVGPVTVGTGSTSPAMLVGGDTTAAPGTLTIDKSVTFKALSTYRCILNRSTPKASKVSALGVAIRSNSKFVFFDPGTATLVKGRVFRVIDNTSASPISGTFSNLPNGSTFTSNGTTFKASYFGGTGNDLTLTVQ